MTAASRPAGEQPEGRVTRLLSPGLDAALEQFSNPELLAAGKVNVIALDAIMERSGRRWPSRRELVHDHVQGVLDRQLGSQGYHLRISDTDVLICQPELAALTGQAMCLRLLREILGHFLGEGTLADIGVHRVLSVSTDGVEAQKIDVRAAYAAAATIEANNEEPSLKGSKKVFRSVDVWTPFVGSNGQTIEVTCALQAVRELKGLSEIGFRFLRRVTDSGGARELSSSDLARLSRSDRLRIDLGAIMQGMNALQDEHLASEPLTLIIPISFSSLSNLDGRAHIADAFQEARDYARQGVICELREIEGVPVTTLLPCVGMVRPYSLFVIGHVSELTRAEARVLKDAGLRGTSMECPPNLGDARFIGWAKSAILTAKEVARSVLLYSLSSDVHSHMAAALGATHTTLANARGTRGRAPPRRPGLEVRPESPPARHQTARRDPPP